MMKQNRYLLLTQPEQFNILNFQISKVYECVVLWKKSEKFLSWFWDN